MEARQQDLERRIWKVTHFRNGSVESVTTQVDEQFITYRISEGNFYQCQNQYPAIAGNEEPVNNDQLPDEVQEIFGVAPPDPRIKTGYDEHGRLESVLVIAGDKRETKYQRGKEAFNVTFSWIGAKFEYENLYMPRAIKDLFNAETPEKVRRILRQSQQSLANYVLMF